MKLVAQGAEAKIFEEGSQIIKERFSKKYRLSELDASLRKLRTRKEAKIIQVLQNSGFASPKLIDVSEKEMLIHMEKIPGPKLRDIFNSNAASFGEEIGNKIAQLHQRNIIHSDLTTSNMIFDKEIKLIDFGLSFVSDKIEDKAVDLHLLKQALEAKHFKNWQILWKQVENSYKNSKESGNIIERLKAVEKRGRYKDKY